MSIERPFPTDVHTIAFSGDWHGNTGFAQKSIAALPEDVDVLIQLGDFGFGFTPKFLHKVNRAALERDLLVLFIDGNHENFDYLDRHDIDEDGVRRVRSNVWHLPRGFRWDWGGVRFLALGGAHSVDRTYRTPGRDWWSQERITWAQAETAIAGGGCDVMLCHDTVGGYAIPGLLPATMFPESELVSADQHRELLSAVAEQVTPRYLWHGHYHSRYTADLDRDWGTLTVTGLDCDGARERDLHASMQIVTVQDLHAHL